MNNDKFISRFTSYTEGDLISLTEHLKRYNIRYIEPAKYKSWARNKLGVENFNIFDDFMHLLNSSIKTKDDTFEFYNFISDFRIAYVAHSLESETILSSGIWINNIRLCL